MSFHVIKKRGDTNTSDELMMCVFIITIASSSVFLAAPVFVLVFHVCVQVIVEARGGLLELYGERADKFLGAIGAVIERGDSVFERGDSVLELCDATAELIDIVLGIPDKAAKVVAVHKARVVEYRLELHDALFERPLSFRRRRLPDGIISVFSGALMVRVDRILVVVVVVEVDADGAGRRRRREPPGRKGR